MTDRTNLAAALLRDAIISGMRIATETPIEQVPAAIADVLAALSRALDPALAERAGEVLGEAGLLASTCERSGQHKRAETIRAAVMAGTDLLTANAALRIVMEECYKDREMKLATRIAERLATLPARDVGVPADVRDYAIDVSEAFDTLMEVERNPAGAWQALQALAGHIAALAPTDAAQAREAAARLLLDMLHMRNGAHEGVSKEDAQKMWDAASTREGYAAVDAFLRSIIGEART